MLDLYSFFSSWLPVWTQFNIQCISKNKNPCYLTPWSLVMQRCVNRFSQHWFSSRHVISWMSSHNLIQCWLNVAWTDKTNADMTRRPHGLSFPQIVCTFGHRLMIRQSFQLIEVYRHCPILCHHLDGLVQERRNSSVLAMSYVILAITHSSVLVMVDFTIIR